MDSGIIKKVVAFYHRGDLDGVSSGAILHKVFSTQHDLTLIGVEYGDDIDAMKLTEGSDLVYVVDFTFEPFVQMLDLNRNRNLIWIDHHKSSLEHVKKYPDVKFKGVLGDNKKSACELLWEYFYPNNSVPHIISQISIFDTWQHNFNDDILNLYSGAEIKSDMNPKSKFWEEMFSNTGDIQNLIDIGKMIRQYDKMKNKIYAENHAFETEFDGYKAIAINIGIAGSIKFDAVYDEKKHDIMLAFSRRSNGIWKISLYTTKKSIDCSAICRKYGGGGHAGAAGFEVSTIELPFKI